MLNFNLWLLQNIYGINIVWELMGHAFIKSFSENRIQGKTILITKIHQVKTNIVCGLFLKIIIYHDSSKHRHILEPLQ